MRKRIIAQDSHGAAPPASDWLDLEALAQVELTSEDAEHPIESALKPGGGAGWRASAPGRQTIRLVFDHPLKVKRIHLVFREQEQPRTQEFILRWCSAESGHTYKDIVRQQYTFSPPDNTSEREDYEVELNGVTGLELTIIPEISGGQVRASIAELRLA